MIKDYLKVNTTMEISFENQTKPKYIQRLFIDFFFFYFLIRYKHYTQTFD